VRIRVLNLPLNPPISNRKFKGMALVGVLKKRQNI
jgi:hypothetical protein